MSVKPRLLCVAIGFFALGLLAPWVAYAIGSDAAADKGTNTQANCKVAADAPAEGGTEGGAAGAKPAEGGKQPCVDWSKLKGEEEKQQADNTAATPQNEALNDLMFNPERTKNTAFEEMGTPTATAAQFDKTPVWEQQDSLQSPNQQGLEPKSVQTENFTAQQAADWKGRFDPAQVMIGGDGSGMVRGRNCPGGKWCVDVNDGSQMVGLNDSRYMQFTPVGPSQKGIDALDTGYLKPTSGPMNGYSPAQVQMAEFTVEYGRAIGAPEAVIQQAVTVGNIESRFRPYTSPGTTSAWGQYQYVGDTWNRESAALNGGTPLNRNNIYNQMEVEYAALNNRYEKYSNSAKLQSQYSFGQYDYRIHHDGTTRTGVADPIYFKQANKGAAIYEYAGNTLGGAAINGVAVAYQPATLPAAAVGGVNLANIAPAAGPVRIGGGSPVALANAIPLPQPRPVTAPQVPVPQPRPSQVAQAPLPQARPVDAPQIPTPQPRPANIAAVTKTSCIQSRLAAMGLAKARRSCATIVATQ